MKGYETISTVYGDDTAKRSGVRLMNHIDEGLAILDDLGADQWTKDAYCLHPIIQNDKTFREFNPTGHDPLSIMLATEYRAVANASLSYHQSPRYLLSARDEVNLMLVADKVQNLKDFLKYHASHPRAHDLHWYFWNWLDALRISAEHFDRLATIAENISTK